MNNCNCSKCLTSTPASHMIADWDNDLLLCIDCAIELTDKGVTYETNRTSSKTSS